MRRLFTIVAVAVFVFALLGGWRAGASEVANMELQQDMHDLALAPRSNWGYTKYHSDDDFRQAVITKAREYGIELTPEQVTVEHQSPNANVPLYLSADYSVPVSVANFSMTLHFTPSSAKNF